ncbi:MAG TPA: cob(I)yrinic acid a,c-diamide adenosyltransferase [Trueperaceae bacterium]
MKIYTRTGDNGTTGLYGGERVAKNHLRVAAYGSVDEANSAIGLARSFVGEPDIDRALIEIQNALFDVGADLATPADAAQRQHLTPISVEDVTWVEGVIDHFSDELEPLSSFILPGGNPGGAALHVARAAVRRAEREVTALAQEVEVDANLRSYLNRVSDLLFTLARVANMRSGVSETRLKVRGRSRQRRSVRR